MDGFLPASELNRAQRRKSAATSRGKKVIAKRFEGFEFDNSASPEVSVEELNRRVSNSVTHLLQSSYFETFCKTLEEALQESTLCVSEIVCYGLGTFGNSATARYQLAFLILLQRKLQTKVDIFDPTFTTNEIQLLKARLGFNVLLENEEAHRPVHTTSEGTLFYMPHAPHQLVNNLLYTNWCPSALTRVICICNSFTNLKTNTTKSILREELKYIDRAMDLVVEYSISNTFTYNDIFNDLALHLFPAQTAKHVNLPPCFWKTFAKPSYHQLEFVPARVSIPDTTMLEELTLSGLQIS